MIPFGGPWMGGFLLLVAALVAGWLGGLGGRRWRERHRDAELEDRLEGIERRLSKREGKAGREARDGASGAMPRELLGLLSLARGAPAADTQLGVDPSGLNPDMEARRAAAFRAQDAARKAKNGT